MSVNSNHLVVKLGESGAVFGDVVTLRKSEVSEIVTELLVSARSSEFELSTKAYVDSKVDWFVNAFGGF